MGLRGIQMTKRDYSKNLERYHKAMNWYHETKDVELQERYLPSFEKILSNLEQGCAELNPSEYEIIHGFNLGGEAH